MEDELFPRNSPRSPEMSEELRDPSDPLAPEIEEEDRIPRPPVADQEVVGENEIDADDASDLESELSEVDERQFEDFDPTAIAIEDRPAIAVDETTVGQLGKHKRKRADGDDDDRKKKKERRREKPKKNRRRKAGSEEFEGGPEIDGKRARKKRDGERGNARDAPTDFDLESLTPQERRRRALDAAMDAALRNPNARRRKADGIVSLYIFNDFKHMLNHTGSRRTSR
jgi:transcription factor SPN1